MTSLQLVLSAMWLQKKSPILYHNAVFTLIVDLEFNGPVNTIKVISHSLIRIFSGTFG